MAILAAIAGVALREVWHGTTRSPSSRGPRYLIAALDAAEPLAQEVDHPDRTDLVPVEHGLLFARHLPAVAMIMLFVGLVGSVSRYAFEHTMAGLVLGAIALLPASLAAAASRERGPAAARGAVQGRPARAARVRRSQDHLSRHGPLLLALAGTAPVIAAARAVTRPETDRSVRGHRPRPPAATYGSIGFAARTARAAKPIKIRTWPPAAAPAATYGSIGFAARTARAAKPIDPYVAAGAAAGGHVRIDRFRAVRAAKPIDPYVAAGGRAGGHVRIDRFRGANGARRETDRSVRGRRRGRRRPRTDRSGSATSH